MRISVSALVINLLVAIVFIQNMPWPLWNVWFPLLFLCFLLISFFNSKRILSSTSTNLTLVLYTLVLLFFFVIFQSFRDFRTSSLVSILLFFQLFYLTQEEKIHILNNITSVLAFIVAFSLPLWLINQYVYHLPFGYEMHYGEWKGVQSQVLENYIFFINAKHDYFARFYSIFDEPGTLGTLSAFILFANKYNFRDKRNLIILAGSIFTFSLAFYILTLIGLMLYYVRTPKLIIIFASSFTIIIIILFYLLRENLTFRTNILSRITTLEKSLDSRTAEQTNFYFKNYITSSDFFLGKGTDFFQKNKKLVIGNGFKFFLIENGIIGFLLILGMYFLLAGKSTYLGYSFMALLLISFLQRPFLFTPYQLIIFSAGIANLKSKT